MDLLAPLRRELLEHASRGEHGALSYAFVTPDEVARTFDDDVVVKVAGGADAVLLDVVDELAVGGLEILGGPTSNNLTYQAMALVPLDSGEVTLPGGTTERIILAIVEVEDYRGISAVPILGWTFRAGRHAGRTSEDLARDWVAPGPRAPGGLRARWAKANRADASHPGALAEVPGAIAAVLAQMAAEPVTDAGWWWTGWRLLVVGLDGTTYVVRESAPTAPVGKVPRRGALQEAVLKAIEAEQPEEPDRRGGRRRRVVSLNAELDGSPDAEKAPGRRPLVEGPAWTGPAIARPEGADDLALEHLLPLVAGDIPMTPPQRALLEQMVDERRVTESGLSPSQAAAEALKKSENTLKAQIREIRARGRRRT